MVRQRLTPSSSFTQELISFPEGEVIRKCVECGVCNASCAIASMSDINPRQIVQKILVGAKEPVLNSGQHWICMTCQFCDNRCQHGVSLAEVFRAVRKIAIQDRRIPLEIQIAAQTIVRDGWLLKESYTDHVADERMELGLSSRLTWNSRYTDRIGSKYFKFGGKGA